MGTAFGMEQWLDERDQGAPAALRPVQPAPAKAQARWIPRWLQSARLTRP